MRHAVPVFKWLGGAWRQSRHAPNEQGVDGAEGML